MGWWDPSSGMDTSLLWNERTEASLPKNENGWLEYDFFPFWGKRPILIGELLLVSGSVVLPKDSGTQNGGTVPCKAVLGGDSLT